jgi:hypothetical protein
MTETSIQTDSEQTNSVDNQNVAHLAGVFDSAGSIKVQISKNDKYAIGYSIQPLVTVSVPVRDEAVIGKFMAYCEDEGVRYGVTEKDSAGSMILRVKRLDSIKRFLDPLMPNLVAKYEQSLLMLSEIIPRLEDDAHLDESGFYELMGVVDELNSLGADRNRKYDQEFFGDQWSVQ